LTNGPGATHIHSSRDLVNRPAPKSRWSRFSISFQNRWLEFNAFSREERCSRCLLFVQRWFLFDFFYLIEYVGGHFLSLVTLIYVILTDYNSYCSKSSRSCSTFQLIFKVIKVFSWLLFYKGNNSKSCFILSSLFGYLLVPEGFLFLNQKLLFFSAFLVFFDYAFI
jgi:hypothetical protein